MKLLVVEDEPKAAAYLRKGLAEEGHVVEVAHNGVDGLHLACVHDYDLVILDGMLPGIDGLAVLAALRQSKSTPVLMLTARGQVEDRVRGLQTGADDYLVKPFAFSELVARIQALLRRQGPGRPGLEPPPAARGRPGDRPAAPQGGARRPAAGADGEGVQPADAADAAPGRGAVAHGAGRAGLGHELRQRDQYLAGHDELSLSVRDARGQLLPHSRPPPPATVPTKQVTFDVHLHDGTAGPGRATLVLDKRRDAALLERLAWTLALAALTGAAVISLGGHALVARGLRPLNTLVRQTSALTASHLGVHLDGRAQAQELQPLIEQTNALLDRLALAYGQMEAFNADVAHELNNPISILISSCEVALRRERPAGELREALASNLEELRRIAGIVADMLFLSNAERGVVARRGERQSLARLAAEVLDYHDAALQDAGLRPMVHGDAELAVDAGLVRRALSNLVGNATRFAAAGSALRVEIVSTAPGEAALRVSNTGATIAAEHLPRLFDRFYRVDAARAGASRNHGLGLAIVAAIARMHGGSVEAASAQGSTTIGFTLRHG